MKKYRRYCALLPGVEQPEQRSTIVNEARTEATVYLYDEISSWWNGAQWFIDQIEQLHDVSTINLRINSPGGDVFEAVAMQGAMVRHPATFVAHIDGLAASAASFLIRGADKRVITDGGFLMIHQAMGGAFGNAEDLLSVASALEKIDEAIVRGYVKATGKSEEQVKEWVNAETWFSAEEALEYGFVDEIFEAAPVKSAFDLSSSFNKTPDSVLAAVAKWADPPKPSAPETKEYDFEANARRLALAESM